MFPTTTPSLLFSSNRLFSTFREVEQDGKTWLVVNGVPLVEGVLNGRYVGLDEFGAYFQDWNDVPVVLRHPKQNGGSARVPASDVPVVGRFYNAQIDEKSKRLVGEFWLDKGMLESMDDGELLLDLIKNQSPIEVSTGYWSESIPQVGKHNGVDFGLVDKNIHPDHIALLPDEIGACSVSDGCGLNRNSEMCQNCEHSQYLNAMTKKEAWGNEGMGSYLVVGDPEKPTTWHLPYKKNGKVDRGLAGAAYAALTSNHRGKGYGGPGKAAALAKLKKIYAANKWPLPGEKKTKQNAVDGSYEEMAEDIRDSFYQQFRSSDSNQTKVAPVDYWVEATFPGYVICHADGELYKVGYTMQNGKRVFEDKSNWQQVVKTENYVPVPSQKQNVTGSLPAKGKAVYEKAYKDYKDKGLSDSEAAQRSWGAVKQAGWYQDKDGKWLHKDAKKNQQISDIEAAVILLSLVDSV